MQTIKDNYIYKFSGGNEPVAHASDGETLRFLTRDCFNCQITSEEQTMETIDYEACNPATGPVYVDGAEPGDVLAVDILEITVADHGVVATVKGFGILSELGVSRTRIVEVKDGQVFFNDVTFPAVPMIGVIGTAPSDRSVITGYSFECGGNMDSRKITKGTTVYLPVRVPGGLLSMGDVHAVMGDGEVCETGVEINADIQVRVRIIKEETFATVVLVTIHEGRNRQVRRMFDAVGHRVLMLRRVKFGPLDLGDLKRGQWRELTDGEVAALKKSL